MGFYNLDIDIKYRVPQDMSDLVLMVGSFHNLSFKPCRQNSILDRVRVSNVIGESSLKILWGHRIFSMRISNLSVASYRTDFTQFSFQKLFPKLYRMFIRISAICFLQLVPQLLIN